MPTATIPVIFVTSFAVCFSGAITPGPMLVYTIRESIRRGFVAGPLVVAGHALLEVAVVIGLAVGVARFLEESMAGSVIALLGGLFLLWMGWGMARHPSRHVLPERGSGSDSVAGANRPWMAVSGGVLVSMSNPFWSLWWATIGLSYIVWAADLGVGGLVSFYTGHILADLVWFGLVSIAVTSGRRIMTPGVYRALMVACGLFLVVLGIYFMVSGVGFLRESLAS